MEADKLLDVDRPSVQLARNRLRWNGHDLKRSDTVLKEALMLKLDKRNRGKGI